MSTTNRFVYKGRKTNEISFPLGGIGAGCIGLAGNGRLIDWEIFNHPNKDRLNGMSHFAVKAEKDGKLIDARILHGDLNPPYSGEHLGSAGQFGFGFGPRRENLSGMPHFREHEFHGEFPFAKIIFSEVNFPGKVVLTAWSPFIPTNDYDSSLPAAFFEIEIENTTQESISYMITGALSNPFGQQNAQNKVALSNGIHQLFLTNSCLDKNGIEYGDLTLSTDAKDVCYQEYWYRGRWCDSLETYWKQFTSTERFVNRTYQQGAQYCMEECDTGHLAVSLVLKPGEKKLIRYCITWNVPNCRNYWHKDADEKAKRFGLKNIWKNWYATQWSDSKQSGLYAIKNWQRLSYDTKLYHDALFNSSLPPVVIDAVSACTSVLKTTTCLRLEDGTFYGWEGNAATHGSCDGSCTHVWNYVQALAFLFPKLERSMRKANYLYSVDSDGGSHFRIPLPLGVKSQPEDHRPCADGQFGDVIKAYRDWKICGDTKWLADLWPAIKKTITFAWSKDNYDCWDTGKTGVLWGRQHHTLDMELFGPNSWLSGFYLAALKAASEMALALDDEEFACFSKSLFTKGKAWVDGNLFNGEYYAQNIDLTDKSLLERYGSHNLDHMGLSTDGVNQYWNEEFGQIKYQIGQGCQIDAVTPQWHSNLYGLGEIFDPEQTLSTLKAIFKYNFVSSVRDVMNPWRVYAINDEAALFICTWPDESQKPAIPLPYSTEDMTGFSYAVACHMIQNGLIQEGLSIVTAIRDRYDGEKRNPWNEIECGSNYARSMSAYSLVNACSGLKFDMTEEMIGFEPVKLCPNEDFNCFWSLDSGWGRVSFEPQMMKIEVCYGKLIISKIKLNFCPKQVILQGHEQEFTFENGFVLFNETQDLLSSQTLIFLRNSSEV
jgi:non-lysosomal glucosylceramidase